MFTPNTGLFTKETACSRHKKMPFIQLHRKGSNNIHSALSSTKGMTELKNRSV